MLEDSQWPENNLVKEFLHQPCLKSHVARLRFINVPIISASCIYTCSFHFRRLLNVPLRQNGLLMGYNEGNNLAFQNVCIKCEASH